MSWHDLGEAMGAFSIRAKLKHKVVTQDGFFEVRDNVYIWVMRDGTQKHLKNMTESHINNTINYLNKKFIDFELEYDDELNEGYYAYQRTIEIFGSELLRRKEEGDLSAELKHKRSLEKKAQKKQDFISELPDKLPSNVLMVCGVL